MLDTLAISPTLSTGITLHYLGMLQICLATGFESFTLLLALEELKPHNENGPHDCL